MTKAQKKAARSFRSAIKSAKRSEQRFFNSTRNAWAEYRDFNRGYAAIEAWIEMAAAYRLESRF